MRALAIAAVSILAFMPANDAAAKQRRHHTHEQHHAKKHRHAKPKPPAPTRRESFDGTCKFSGAVTFTPPMTSSPQATQQHANAPGTCTGTFVDGFGRAQELTGAPVTYRAESGGDRVSCAFGLASGEGVLVFDGGEIAFVMHEYRAAATPLIRLDGKDAGGAWMVVTPSQSSDPAATVMACNAGGLERFDFDAQVTTDGTIGG